MKRCFKFTKNDSGFILPYVLVIVTIVLIVITTNINIYEQEVELTDHYLEHIKIETLLQMAHHQFNEDYDLNETSRIRTEYKYPVGSVKVTFTPAAAEPNKLYFAVNTDQGTRYTFLKQINATEN